MIKPEYTKAIDLIASIPIAALAAMFSFLAISYLYSEIKPPITFNGINYVINMLVMIFIPISVISQTPSYFILRRINSLGLIQIISVGIIVGIIISVSLHTKNIEFGAIITSSSVIASGVGYVVLLIIANKRERKINA